MISVGKPGTSLRPVRRKKVLIALALLFVLGMASLRVHYVHDEMDGSLLWNPKEAFLFLGVGQLGYRFSYLGMLLEAIREVFPFGASAPNDKHSYLVVLRVTPEKIERYSFDNFWIGSPPSAIGQYIYAGNLLDPRPGPRKWAGAQFEPTSPEEQEELREAGNAGRIPAAPNYDNIGGWSRRVVGGEVVRKSAADYVEEDARFTAEIGGEPLVFVMNSGFISHEAFVDLIRPGHGPERVWFLNEKVRRVGRAEYKKIFGST